MAFPRIRTPRLRIPARAELRGWGGWRWVAVAAFFFLAAVVQTWPLVLHADDSLSYWPVHPEDTWMNLWNFWSVKHSLLGLSNPFHTDQLFYPQGADLYLHTLNTVNAVLSIPLQLLTGNLVLSWNILALLLFAASGVSTYALARRFTNDDIVSLAAGFIFAFAPFVMMRFQGHWNIATVWPLPIFALFLFRFQENGRWYDAVGAGLIWAIIGYTNPEYAVDAALFTGVFVLFWSLVYLGRREWRRLRSLLVGMPLVGATLVLAGAPLLLPAIVAVRGDEISMPDTSEVMSSDLAALVTPSPLWGPGKLPVWDLDGFNHFPAGDIENTVYMGLTPLLLAGAALLTVRRLSDVRVFWFAVFLLFVSLAMGPHLFIGQTESFLPLPYQIYDRIPVLSERRSISRMIVFGHLALAMLAALGFKTILVWLKDHYSAFAPVAAVFLFAFVIVEYWSPPILMERVERPEALAAISTERGDFAVLDAPLGRSTWTVGGTQVGAALAMYYQPIFGKPTLGGYLSRAPDKDVHWMNDKPGIKYVACPGVCPDRPDAADLDPILARQTFREYKIKYIALHYITPSEWLVGGEELNRLDAYIRDVLGFREVYKGRQFTLFQDPEFPSPDGSAATSSP